MDWLRLQVALVHHFAVVYLFTFTTFLSALLLFSVQPLVARLILPSLGGSPAVWNTSMVFFQAVLLGGYLYAHALGLRLQLSRKALWAHAALLLLPLPFLPLAVPPDLAPPTSSQPLWWLLGVLTACVGAPFFVLSTSSPLLQRMFALTSHRHARDPYFLYAASNAGSLIALLSYPLFFEPNLALSQQTRVWAALYGLFVLCLWSCAVVVWRAPRRQSDEEEAPAAPIPARRVLRWLVLALVPSSLMLSVTTYLSSEVAAIPLLWIVPLSLYLVSFMVVFARKPLVPPAFWARALAIFVLPLVVAIAGRAGEPLALLVALHLGVFFLACVVCHGELARDRPPASQLTQFYGWMALGGVIGGALNALAAPLIFSDVLEYPLSLVALVALLPRDLLLSKRESSEKTVESRSKMLDFLLPLGVGGGCFALVQWLQSRGLESGPAALGLMFGVPAIVSFAFSRRPIRFALAIGAILWCGTFYRAGLSSGFLREARSFFGVHRVLLSPDRKWVLLTHGATNHGVQRAAGNGNARQRLDPVSYYSRRGPAGDIIAAARARKPNLRVAVIGLGAGGVAGYIERGQNWTFYEIDPQVAAIAHDSKLFTFWNEAATPPRLVLGDARLQLKTAPRGHYDLILLDAYSSDTVPVHLLTREALAIYRDKLAPGGLIGWHISNAHFDLEPVVGQLALDAKMASLTRRDTVVPQAATEQRIAPSQWAVLGAKPEDLRPMRHSTWKSMRLDAPLWSDEKSSLWSLMVRKWTSK